MLYDEILEKAGGWGKYQKFLCLLLALSAVPNGYFTMTPVFTNKVPEHRCRIPEIDGFSENGTDRPDYNAIGVGDYIPWDKDNNRYYRCKRFSQSSAAGNSTSNFVPCNFGYVYDVQQGEQTAVSEFDLVCDQNYLRPQITAIYMSGILFGSILSGAISDRYGRWPVIIWATYLQFVFMGLNIFNVSHLMYAIFMFFAGCCSLINFVAAVVLAAELVDAERRALVETAIMLGFSFGYVLLPLFAYFIVDWKWFLLAGGVSGILYIPYWCLIPESPRWLITQKRYDEARDLIAKIAQKNGRKIDVGSLFSDENLKLVECEKSDTSTCKLSATTIPYVDLFIRPAMLIKTLCTCFSWFVISMTYYTLSLNTGNLGGNDFINCFISAALEIPAYLSVYFVLWRKGRRFIMMAYLLFSAVTCVATPLIANVSTIGAVICSMTGKFFVTCVFSLVYLYTTELFPTEARNQALGLSSTFARVGSIVSPYIIYIGEISSASLPYFIIGGFAVVAAAGNLILPETQGRPLADTYEEAGKLRREFRFCRSRDDRSIEIELKQDGASLTTS